MSKDLAYATKHFKWTEFACKGWPHCDCGMEWALPGGITNVEPIALKALEQLRVQLNTPLIITSACRCPTHNRREGGAENSKHISTPRKGSTAFDISTNPVTYIRTGKYYTNDPWTAPKQDELKKTAMKCGFNGIGTYKTWIHVDVRDHVARW